MLVDNNVYSHLYVGNGTTKEFPFRFPILESSHILVRRKDPDTPPVTLKISDDYTLNGVKDPEGGSVLLKKAPIFNAELLLALNVPFTQITKYIELDVFPSLAHEDALSKLTLITQQLVDKLNRTVSIPEWGAPDIPCFPNDPGKPMTPEEFIVWFVEAWCGALKAAEEAKEAAKKACDCAAEACYCADVSCGCAGTILTPSIIEPSAGSNNVTTTPLIRVTDFAYEGRRDVPINTQIQIARATDTGYLNPVWQYNSAYTTVVQVENIAVTPPTIMFPSNNATSIIRSPVIQLSSFATTGAIDTPKGSRISIALRSDPQFLNPVWEYSGAYVTAKSISPTLLDATTQYIICAAHEGTTLGWSTWSAINNFTTGTLAPSVIAPTVLTPANNASNIDPALTIQLSTFAVQDGSDTPAETEIQIALAIDTTFMNTVWEYTGPYLASVVSGSPIIDTSKDYIIRARHKGVNFGWSAWSTINEFATAASPPILQKPHINSPTGLNTSLGPDIIISQFTVTNGTDMPLATQCQVTTVLDMTFHSPIWEYDGIYDNTVSMMDIVLQPNTQYRIRARHSGVLLGWSAWSDPVVATTTAEYIHAPSIVLIGHTTPEPAVFTPIEDFELSDFSSTAEDTMSGLTIRVTKTSDTQWVNASTDARILTGKYVDNVLMSTTMNVTTTSHCKGRARYLGSSLPSSAWGPERLFDIEAWGIAAPTATIDNAAVANRKIKILFNPWAYVGTDTITPDNMYIQIATSTGFTDSTLVFDNTDGSPVISANVTSYQMTQALEPNTQYYLRAMRSGSMLANGYVEVKSVWGLTVSFHTAT